MIGHSRPARAFNYRLVGLAAQWASGPMFLFELDVLDELRQRAGLSHARDLGADLLGLGGIRGADDEAHRLVAKACTVGDVETVRADDALQRVDVFLAALGVAAQRVREGERGQWLAPGPELGSQPPKVRVGRVRHQV